MHFLRGNAQTPKGHAILVARSSENARIVLCTYCIVPPIPMSLAKYLSPLLAAQFPMEELRDSVNVAGMPIPPMLEEVESMDYLEMLAERRSDDLCDLGTVNPRDEAARVQMAALGSQEYGQLYASYVSTFGQFPSAGSLDEPASLDELDAEELFLQAMPERQKLTELGKLVGMARYALEGHDKTLLQETERKMQRIGARLAEKYRANKLIEAAVDPQERGARLAELYLSRAFKLLDEEYAAIPGIERAIRELTE